MDFGIRVGILELISCGYHGMTVFNLWFACLQINVLYYSKILLYFYFFELYLSIILL